MYVLTGVEALGIRSVSVSIFGNAVEQWGKKLKWGFLLCSITDGFKLQQKAWLQSVILDDERGSLGVKGKLIWMRS